MVRSYPDTGLQDLGSQLYAGLNLPRAHPAGPDLHHLLHSVLEVKVALGVVLHQVASVGEPLLSEELLGVPLPPQISLHPGGTADHQFPSLVRPQPGPGVEISDEGRAADHQAAQTSTPSREGLRDAVQLRFNY